MLNQGESDVAMGADLQVRAIPLGRRLVGVGLPLDREDRLAAVILCLGERCEVELDMDMRVARALV